VSETPFDRIGRKENVFSIVVEKCSSNSDFAIQE
jgi:hypothetical protein